MPDTPSPADRVAAYLAEVRQRARAFDADVMEFAGAQDSAADVPRLLAAVEALLTQACRWDEEAPALVARAGAERNEPGIVASVMYARAQAIAERAAELRDVIAASLLGEDGADVPFMP